MAGVVNLGGKFVYWSRLLKTVVCFRGKNYWVFEWMPPQRNPGYSYNSIDQTVNQKRFSALVQQSPICSAWQYPRHRTRSSDDRRLIFPTENDEQRPAPLWRISFSTYWTDFNERATEFKQSRKNLRLSYWRFIAKQVSCRVFVRVYLGTKKIRSRSARVAVEKRSDKFFYGSLCRMPSRELVVVLGIT